MESLSRIISSRGFHEDNPDRSIATPAINGTSVCVTDEGRLGLGPFSAQPGEVICALLGCDWTITLRPVLPSLPG